MRWRYTLRQVLVLQTLVSIAIATYSALRDYRTELIWQRYEAARLERDRAQAAWQAAFQQRGQSPECLAQEQAARQRYFMARDRLSAERQ